MNYLALCTGVACCYRYGGVPGYLSSTGFTTEEQQALKDIFLE